MSFLLETSLMRWASCGLLGVSTATSAIFLELSFLIASVLFIFGLKGLTHPRTAVRGNRLGAMGMALATIAACCAAYALGGQPISRASWILAGIALVIGSSIGTMMALRVQMTAMPQMVALLNGLGGMASALVAGGALMVQNRQRPPLDELLAAGLTGLIGGVTFSGSIMAFAKLQEYQAFRKPFQFPRQQLVNAALGIVCLLAIGAVADEHYWMYVPLVGLALVLGVFLVSPIGGADMPVVIALLNSYSGLAAAAAGFVVNNSVLIIAGSLVGASGIILTNLMCKAMNRSLFNVLFGVMGGGSSQPTDEIYATVRSTTPDDVAILLDGVQRVVFVPGYGMAVAQAQHAVRDLGRLLESKGTTVEYAIHPVAGRMPGHMNVLLAEADVEYDKLKEMEEINLTMDTVDVAIVIGANDVVNPVAQTDPQSPIAGMPIIEVAKARTVVVIKRSLSPGFAGIPNPLFAAENTLMLYADGQKAVLDIVRAIKEG